jgi:hypothetical protein
VIAAYFAFHDCDLETLRWATTTMRLFYPEAAYAEPPSARPTVPSTFVLPRHDRTLRPEWMRTVARERLEVEPIEVDGGHFPTCRGRTRSPRSWRRSVLPALGEVQQKHQRDGREQGKTNEHTGGGE